MRKKLVILGFALVATAAALAPAAATGPVNSFCPQGTRRIDCVDRTGFICCPDNAMCFC